MERTKEKYKNGDKRQRWKEKYDALRNLEHLRIYQLLHLNSGQ